MKKLAKVTATTRKTKKLIDASRVLADERFCDDDDTAVLRGVQAGVITVKQVYSACQHFGYRWDSKQQRWRLQYPHWVRNWWRIRRKEQ